MINYLVDCCSGTFYYTSQKAAMKAFYKKKDAHTVAKKINGVWYPIREIIKTQKDGEVQN